MHEMTLCGGILNVIHDEVRARAVRRVTAVRLQVGALACVEPEALRFGFDVMARGTLAEGAQLHIDEVPAHAWCAACERTVEVREPLAPCPCCDAPLLPASGGDGLRVTELEIE